jgi:hypothetical protein
MGRGMPGNLESMLQAPCTILWSGGLRDDLLRPGPYPESFSPAAHDRSRADLYGHEAAFSRVCGLV